MENVVVVTVTFNSSNYLARLIDSLKKQTYPINKVFVVDNNSNKQHRDKIKRIQEDNRGWVNVIWLKENTGGAGGFSTGMQYMLSNYSSDWMWIMDDDAFPRNDCLENLLIDANKLDNLGFIAPLIYGIENKRFQLYHHKRFDGNLLESIMPIKSVSDINGVSEIEANAFVGPLFPISVITDVGIVNGGLFIYGDDTEYTYRVTRKYKGYVTSNAIINHRDPGVTGNNSVNPKAWWKDYYEIRNNALFIREFSSNLLQKCKYDVALFMQTIKKITKAIVKSEYKGYRLLRIKLLSKAFLDGLRGFDGKTIDPEIYAKSLNNV